MEAVLTAPPRQHFPLWRRLWFRHPFRFEANLSPEAYAEAINKYNHKSITFWQAESVNVKLGVQTGTIPFTITTVKKPKYSYYLQSRAKGEISVDPLSGRTVISGRVSFLLTPGFVLTFFVMLLALTVGIVGEVCAGLFGMAIMLFILIAPHADRVALMDLLEKTAISGYITQSYELSKTQRKKQKKIIHKSQKNKKG